MNVETLEKLGLSETQSRAYILLIKCGSLTPPETAKELDIKRTNAYAVLDQLVELNLANKREVKKFNTYFPENPVALERLAREQRDEAMNQERKVQAALPALMKYFNTYSDQPGVSFYQGTEEIKDIYNDMLRTRQDIHVMRSPRDQDLMSTEYFMKYKRKKAQLGIKTHMINSANHPQYWGPKFDKEYNLDRTVVSKDDYTSNVEFSAYGDKMGIISFGDEAVGMIIDSPQIADAFRQMFELAKKGAVSSEK